MNVFYWLLLAIIILSELYILYAWNPKREPKGDYTQSYQAKMLLTKNEWNNCMKLKDALEPAGFSICAKVRLADLVEPKKELEKGKWQTAFNRVNRKHIDFVICDSTMHVKLCLELDDSSHDRTDRQQRDVFVDSVLKNCGYQIIHIRSVEQELAAIKAALNIVENAESHA